MALAGLGFQGTSSKYVQSTRDINTQLRKEPKEDESANFMNVSLLPGEIGEVVGYDCDKWVRLRLALGAVGWVRKKYLISCPEGTHVHERLTAVPSGVRKVELPRSGSRFVELQALLDSANTHHQDIRAARIWHIIGHYLGETGMVTGTKERCSTARVTVQRWRSSQAASMTTFPQKRGRSGLAFISAPRRASR